MKRHRIIFLAALLCGAGLGQGGTDQPISRYGLVSVTRLNLHIPGMAGAIVTPSALFSRRALGGELGQSKAGCQVFAGAPDQSGGAAGGSPQKVPPPSPDSLDAGDPITISGAGQKDAFATLKRTVAGSSISYQPQAQGTGLGLAALTRPLPAGASVNIPGAPGANGFPAFKDAALPSAPALAFSAPTDPASFTPEQPVRWQGASQSGTLLLTGTDEEKQVFFVCSAPDTGSFDLPAATQAELKAKGFESGQLSAVRSVSRVLRQGDAQLTLSLTDIVSGQMPGS